MSLSQSESESELSYSCLKVSIIPKCPHARHCTRAISLSVIKKLCVLARCFRGAKEESFGRSLRLQKAC